MHFLRFRDLTPQCNVSVINAYLDIAKQFKNGQLQDNALTGKHAVLLFEKPSLRTKLSFSIAAAKLGMQTTYFAPQEVGLGRREAIADVATVVARMADVAIIRTFEQSTLDEFAANSRIAVINALSDGEHPCQAMADLMTIREQFGKINGLKVAYIGDGSNVAVSLAWAVVKAGGQMSIITPPRYEVPQNDIAAISTQVQQTHDIDAVRAADVVYTDTWTSMGAEDKAQSRRIIFEPYRVTHDLMASANKNAIFMHCLPAHEGDEVEKGVLRSPQSFCFRQAENRLWAQMAILYGLFHKIEEG